MSYPYKTVLFDFDGTVFDTVEGITKSVQYALKKHGIEAELPFLRQFAGPPLVEKFVEVYGVSWEEGERLVLDFRERYTPIGVFESAPFPGIRELLEHLKGAGLRLCIATSKPQTPTDLLLSRSDLARYFELVIGSREGINDQSKAQIITSDLAKCGAKPAEAALIGDTKYDVLGAKECGIGCIGAAWGYAQPGELEAAGAIAIAADCRELEEILLPKTE